MSDKETTNDELSFSAAMEELERILRGIEDEEIDIDVLGRELKRAAGLLELCRGKIRRAQTEVSQIVQGLDEGAEGRGSEPETPVESGPDGGDELPF